jgi:hypothetical protein
LQELGTAINDTVSSSCRVESLMQAIRDSGYEVYLTLEASIAIERRSDQGEDGFTTDDRNFLKRLRIEC